MQNDLFLKIQFMILARCEIFINEACMCLHMSTASPLDTVFKSKVTQTEQNSIDKICVSVAATVS